MVAESKPDDANLGDLEIPLRGDARTAGRRLELALRDTIEAGFQSPRIAGSIDFPRVSFWRSRGRLVSSPYARFDGVIRESAEGATIVGRVRVPARGSSIATILAMWTGLIAVLALAASLASGRLIGVLVSAGLVAVLSGYLLLLWRFGRAGIRAESELLIRELHELAGAVRKPDR